MVCIICNDDRKSEVIVSKKGIAVCMSCDEAISSVLEEMKKEEETKGEHKMKLELTYMNHKGIADFIASNPSKTYEGKNGDGERLTATVKKGVGMTVHTYQSNGKVRVNTYNKEGFQTNETFEEK